MDWKQPEGLRRHWTMEELDAELLFLQTPVNAAQGRVGDDVYDLRDGGQLRKVRTLSRDGTEIARLEEKAAGAGGTLRLGAFEYVWKPANLMGTTWALHNAAGVVVFRYVLRPGLVKAARLEMLGEPLDNLGVLALLTWYVAVL
ncbi:MAG TPA: hypothetical protein VFQ91_07965 [Bryobacteraceae bacterium]|nr:hypothetical protein [Bryobacteraceae bacterium]